MRSILRTAACAAAVICLAAPATTQYRGEDPALIGTTRAFPTAFLGSGITELGAVSFTPVPGAPTGRFYTTLSVRRAGGAGGWDVVTGIYDDATFPPSFTKNADVDALNTAGDDFAGSVSNDLLVYTLDTPIGAMFSVRASTSVAFPMLLPIGPPVAAGNIDGSLCVLDGVESFVYVQAGEIWAADFNRGAYKDGTRPASSPRRIAGIPPGALGLRSPSPVPDSAGETRALTVAIETAPGVFAAGFAASVQDRDLPRVVLEGAANLSFAAVVGGTTVWASESGGTYGDPEKVDFLGVSADRAAAGPGGQMHISVFVPYTFFGPPVLATALIGTRAARPQPIAGFAGALGLLPPVAALPVQSLPPRVSNADFVLALDAVPAGLVLDAQAILFDTASGQVILGNNAPLETR